MCFGGLTAATEIGYSTYIYAKVGRERYQQVTSNTKSAALFGRCFGAVLSQLLIMFGVMNPQGLLYINFGGKKMMLGK